MFAEARQFIKLARAAQLLAESNAPWETKYDLIFSPDVSGAIKKTGIRLDYCDPDTSYEEDVRAFVSAATEKADELECALRNLPE